MEELAKIITTISLITGVSRVSILNESDAKGRDSRILLCYAVRNGYAHLMDVLIKMTGLSTKSIGKLATMSVHKSREDEHFDRFMQTIIRNLNLSTKVKEDEDKAPAEKKQKPKTIKRKYPKWNPFGLTVLDDIKRRIAIEKANAYMDKFCQIGVQPIAEGMVYTRGKANEGRKRWYKD